MTETPTRLSTLQEWLDALVLAAPVDRRMVAIEGSDAGLALMRVHCDRHDAALNWLSAFAHLDRTEGTHRLQHGSAARLHEPGDLHPGAPPVGKFALCKRCHLEIVWARTHTGVAIPLDAVPSDIGTVVLSPHPDGGSPLATFLHTESERFRTPLDSRFTRHAQTCRQ